ncbi:Mobile element protein [Methanosarcina lacustris Z-7289]|uniref:Mobile element protein n=1 Tax=Methanosarcina lacustris Z-7289 TaxID=1434111 RepID=A0A0E3S3Q2_9EURY|nr:Mobile element protein [Methanosarcina lacustris Z-7289]
MALVMLAVLILFQGIVLIMRFHNPLKILNAEELARILNHDNDNDNDNDNDMRERERASRLKDS